MIKKFLIAAIFSSLVSLSNANAGLVSDADDMFDFLQASGGNIQASTTGTFDETSGNNVFDAGDIIAAVSHFTVRTASDGGAPTSNITTTNGTTAALVWVAQLGQSTDVSAASFYSEGTATASAGGFTGDYSLSNLSSDAEYANIGSAFAVLLVSPDTGSGGVNLNSLTNISDINTAAASGNINIAATYTLNTTGSNSADVTYVNSPGGSVNQLVFNFVLDATYDTDLVGDSRFTLGTETLLASGPTYSAISGIDGYTYNGSSDLGLTTGSKTFVSFTADVLPEPSSLVVFAGLGFGMIGRRRRRASKS